MLQCMLSSIHGMTSSSRDSTHYDNLTQQNSFAQDGGQKVSSIFERARALGAREGNIADLQQPSSSGDMLHCL